MSLPDCTGQHNQCGAPRVARPPARHRRESALKVEGALKPKLGAMPSVLRRHTSEFDDGSNGSLESRLRREECRGRPLGNVVKSIR
jgi:hypothetical protein